MLRFGKNNAKLKKLQPYLKNFLKELGIKDEPKLATFQKLSGHTCPYAKLCKSSAVKTGNKTKVVDGPHTKYRCYSASQEAMYPGLYNLAKHNTDLISNCNTVDEVKTLILESIPPKVNVIRIHVGGDFSTQREFDGWLEAAKSRPGILFYAYTKSLIFWVRRKKEIPKNFILTASYGGYFDHLIKKHRLRFVRVVFSEAEARRQKLELDHDDSHASNPLKRRKSFALLLHGTQPKGSQASKALKQLKGKGSYR